MGATSHEIFSGLIQQLDVNADAKAGVLHFKDGTTLQFIHASRSERWAKASSDCGTAKECCNLLRQFRLNGKHLQLFFIDGSNLDLPSSSFSR